MLTKAKTQYLLSESVAIEWKMVEGKSPQITQSIKDSKEILIKIYTKAELDFAKKFPQAVQGEMFLKSLAPLFDHGIEHVDWNNAQEKIKSVLYEFFDRTDFAQFANTDDIYIFVVAKDVKTKALLGMIQFMISANYEYGHVRVGLYGVTPQGQDLQIDKLLMSSIFTLVPSTRRLFLHVRKTNESAIHTYSLWGFRKFDGPLPYWLDLEYTIEQSDTLQKTASIIT